jgi:hypothetical protein
LLREAAVERLGVGLAAALGDPGPTGSGLADDAAVLSDDCGAGVETAGPGRPASEAVEVRCTAPTVPPTATAAATATVAAIPAGEENILIRVCRPVIEPSFHLPTKRLGPYREEHFRSQPDHDHML